MARRGFGLKVVAVIVLIAVCSSMAFGAKKVTYKLNLKKGQKFNSRMTTEQDIEQTAMGRETKTKQNIGIGTDMEVMAVDPNGSMLIKYTYSWAMMEMKGPMGNVTYDSSKDDANAPPLAQGIAALLGQSFTLKMTPEGKVIKIEGLDKMRQNIKEKLGPSGAMMMRGLEKFISEAALKEMTETSTAIYPPKPVAVGDSWNKKMTMTQGFPVIIDNTWTLKNRKKGIATIEAKSTIKPNPEAKPVDMGMAQVVYNLSGSQSGTLKMGESTGMVMSSELKQDFQGDLNIKMAAAPEGKRDMKIPIKVSSVATIVTKELKKGK